MALPLALALVAFPFIEIALLIAVGRELGVLATLALLMAGVVAGVLLIRVQGFATLLRVRAALGRGEPPTAALFHAACAVAAGLLLIVPGFLSDAMALALLALLPFRRLLRAWLWRRTGTSGSRRGPATIEGEYETVDDPAAANPRSPWRSGDAPGSALRPPPSRD